MTIKDCVFDRNINSNINSTYPNNGETAGTGAGVLVQAANESAKVNIDGCTFKNMSSASSSTCVFNITGTTNITNSVFENNETLKTNGYGGNITNLSILNIDGCTFRNNVSKHYGGAIYSSGKSVTIADSAFVQNEAVNGGAIYNCAGTLSIIDSEISDNSLTNIDLNNNVGIAIYLKDTDCTIENSAINNNTRLSNDNSDVYGGAIYVYNKSLTIKNSEIKGNKAAYGGAIGTGNNTNLNLTLIGENGGCVDIENNIATKEGAGLFMRHVGGVKLSGKVIIKDNLCNGNQSNIYDRYNNSMPLTILGSLEGSDIGYTVLKNGTTETSGVITSGYASFGSEEELDTIFSNDRTTYSQRINDDGEVELYTASYYSVSYYDKNGETFSGTHGEKVVTNYENGRNYLLDTPTKQYFTFEGYYLNSDCTGSVITSLEAFSYANDVKLYANWTKTLNDFADEFLDLTGSYCSGDKSFTDTLKNSFNMLSASDKESFIDTEVVEGLGNTYSSNIVEAKSRYYNMVTERGYDQFLEGMNVQPISKGSLVKINTLFGIAEEDIPEVSTVAILSLVGGFSIGGYFLLKKKKFN